MKQIETTFSGLYAELYDDLYKSLDPRSELKQAEIFCGISPGKGTAVIDVGGGTGRFSDLLCQMYEQVYLVEPSTAMTAIARRKLAERINLTIIDDNAQEFKLSRKANSAYLMFSVASYFASPDIFRGAIQNIISNLNPGSHIYFDVWKSNDLSLHGFRNTVKRIVWNEVEYERVVAIEHNSVLEKEPGFHTLIMNISIQNTNTVKIYQEKHELALVSEKWIIDLCSQNQQIKDVRIRNNPTKENNLEVDILIH